MSSPFMKAVDKAFSYFSYGFEQVQKMDDWLITPTVMARVPENEVEASVLLIGFQTVPPVDSAWQQKTTAIISSAAQATEVVSIEPDKHHKNCTGRALLPVDKNWPMELAFPLYNLAKKLGVEEYRQAGIVVYGFRKGVLVFVGAARYRVCDGSVTIK